MCDKLFSWLLRLYPSWFRDAYHQEALQLLHDRARDETGFIPRLRLWLDLIADLVVSLPREYSRPKPKLVAVSAGRTRNGIPEFALLRTEPPHPRVFLLGAALSLLVLFAAVMAMRHSELYTGRLPWFGPLNSSGFHDDRASSPTSAATNRALARVANLSEAERSEVLRIVVDDLKKYYVAPPMGEKMADAVLAHDKHGDYSYVTDGEWFAALLTTQLREVSHDLHLSLRYSARKLPDSIDEPAPEEIAQYRQDMARTNCTFASVKILPGNIGYVKFNEFPDPQVCQDKVTSTMQTIAHADAVIFDLRANRGGDPHMVSLIASYFFDHPTHLNDIYNRSENSTQQFWTLPSVPGPRLAHKPLYVLTSSDTISAAEEFCYDMKNLKRATIVGEVTAGAAHLVRPQRIDDHFMFNLPAGQPINPISKTDWEGTGVQPDIPVERSAALDTARKLALEAPHTPLTDLPGRLISPRPNLQW